MTSEYGMTFRWAVAAVVTGAAQDIGAAFARLSVRQGCCVYVTDINDDFWQYCCKPVGWSRLFSASGCGA